MQRLRTIGKWVLQLLMAVVMVGPGMQKFTGPTWERMFRRWGYPDHFYLLIGGIEVAAGVGLLIPKVATPSALLLAVVMVGAAITRMRNGSNAVGELVFCTVLLVIAYLRRRDMIRIGHTPSPSHGSQQAV